MVTVRSQQSADIRRCIYCLEEKSVADFNEEHVLNEAFGRFNPPVVIHCVCEECNSRFGDSFDRKIARDSPASLARVKERSLPAPSNKGEGRRTTTVLRYSTGAWKRAYARHRARLDGEPPPPDEERLVFEPLPQLGFKKNGATDFVWYLLRDGIAADVLAGDLGLTVGESASVMALGIASEPEAAVAIKGAGFDNLASVPPGPHPVGPLQVDATFELASPELRAVTKMALSYLAFVRTPLTACMPQFNDARRFVLEGVEPVPPLVHSCVNAWRPSNPNARGHYLSVESIGQVVIAQVCLFLELRFVVYLARAGFAIPTDFSSAHFLDLGSKRADPIAPPPLPVASPTTIFGPYANHLKVVR